MCFWNKNIIDNPEILGSDFDWGEILDNTKYGWDRFVIISGTLWKTVIEAKLGNITPEEEDLIKKANVHNEPICPITIKRIKERK